MKKANIMKPETTNHEILLFTGTSFTNREFCSRDDEKDNGRKASPMEELEKACWDGMLYEMFPELPGSFLAKCESFIWNIVSGIHFLRISMGPFPQDMKNERSIDPYFFLPTVNRN